ncbi:PQQ-dependent sugar dehydrogenase [Winogradskyella ouciana]|uniref:T9SS type A sorting domain-containing protein n=3 Tax=Winogradskyella TaxID=286104 RepID=A0A7K1GCX0_9FLAO|nr:PQQ-dependent sugar dehydrogenase [Winogradskyella ouciana]MTE25699.1 T9SS type A sorting domain-containing protein [Winogradskyella ouciana]
MNYFSKKPIGVISFFIKPKSKRLKLTFVIFFSLLLFGYLPYFTGSGLSSAKAIAPYSNGVFPQAIDTDLDATYRVAFPNLTFFYPITFRMVPNQDKIVLGQLNGIIYWFENDESTMNKNLLLDLSAEVGLVSDGGFLGLTIHPDFDAAVNPQNYFYIYYATKNGNGQDSPPFGGYTSQGCSYSDNEYEGNYLILERFEVNPTTMTFVNNSRTTLLKNRMYGTTHYGGGMDFGDDGFLYLTTGDMASWKRSQDIINNLAGGVLRLDVDKDPTKSHPPIRTKPNDAGYPGEITGVEYWIPNTNPFSDTTPGSTSNIYGQPNLTTSNPNDVYAPGDFFEEYYSIGLRNPFRMTKDSQTGTFYIGDVGLNNREEINVLGVNSNFGWPLYEGDITGPGCYSDLFNGMDHQGPLVDFGHDIVNSITGGYVYRGTGIPELFGKYICADYGGGDEIFSVDVGSGDYEQIGTFLPEDIISFGEDDEGELFILRLGFATNIYKLIDDDLDYGPPPQTLSQTGIFSDLATLDVIDGYVPYELYESFWSDGALKKRWIAVPNNDGIHSGPNEQIKYSEYSDWEFPPGTVIVKHFDLQIDDNDPSVTRKIETRVSVVDEVGELYFLTYNWNDDETEAYLQASSLDEPVDIATTTGGTRTQTWHFPSNSDCINCHNHANNGVLGLKSRYLNTDYTYDETGLTANQLVTLSHIGVIDESIVDSDTPNIFTNKSLQDSNATLDEKARSYMDLNCAYCHRRDNSIRTNFDLRSFNNLESTELLTSGILTPLGIDPNEEIVFPGDASKSILHHRMNSVDVAVMMPPISKTIIDQPAVDLIEQWINQLDGDSMDTVNNPNPLINLALLPSAELSGYVAPGEGRGTPLDILYDPLAMEYKVTSSFAEYGIPYNGSGNNLGTVDAENGFYWQVDWPEPKFVNYITFGGSYTNQPQPYTMWRVSYLRDGDWITIEEGQGGWINNDTGQNFINTAIYEWGDENQIPIYAEAIRLQLYSDGIHDLYRIHLRGRGGSTQSSDDADINTEPKASLVQFKPFNNPTSIDNIVVGQQTPCDAADNSYSQELIVTYTNPPATGSLIVNGQSFPITASPQTITLSGLDSDSNGVEVTAEFTDGYNTLYRSNGVLFTAPDDCSNLIVGVDESMTINGDYTVSSTGSIQILEGGSLTVNGNLTIDGDVTLNSISTKYSSLIVTGTTTGTINYKRYINAFNGSTGNDLISPPLKNENFGNFAADNPNIFENPSNPDQKLYGPFNEAAGNYEIYSVSVNSSTDLTSGIGYRAARDSTEDGTYGNTFTFTGEIETGIVNVPITASGSSFDGWNLVGNPYPSYIDFDTFFALNGDELDVASYKAIYGYDGNASDGWTILNNATTGNLIAPGQGFFIKSKSGGGTITFTPAMRTSGNTDDFIQGRESSSAHHGYLRLTANFNTSSHYSTDFYFNDNASLGLDPGYDASFFNNSVPALSIYSHLVEGDSGVALAIQALESNAINDVTIPLGLNASQGQNITINIGETDLDPSINVYLEDTVNNTYTLLNDSSYSFTSDTALNGIGRFYLRFEGDALNIYETPLDALEIFTNQSNKTIVIDGQLETKTGFRLYDINGRMILNNSLNSASTKQVINVEHLTSGVYIIEITSNKNRKRVQKLVVN